MILEYALNEEDDYKRMTNITRGCQQLAQQLPFYNNFTNANLLRQLFCCYPFQQEPIQLLLSIMMDRFQNVDFLNCLFKALMELSQLQEQRAMLGCRSDNRGRRSASNKQILTILGLIQNGQALAKNVIENLVISKQFAITFLKPMFLMIQKLKQSLETKCGIFMSYILNTKDEIVIKQVVDIFQDCKNEIFGACTWVNRIEDQFDSYFYQNHMLRSQQSIYIDPNAPDEPIESSESSIEVDPNEEIQKWICQDKTPLINEQLDYFRSFEYLELIFKYVFDPNHYSTIHEWDHHYSETKIKHSQSSRKPDQQQDIDKFCLIRSLKTIQILIHEQNYPVITKLVPQFLLKLFHYIYDALNDFDKNVDLNQIAYLLDFLLHSNPRQSILLIVELNLMFQFTTLIYNESIAKIVEKIVMDEYDMGNYVYEHFWQYLECTNWISYFICVSLRMQVDTFKTNKNYQSDKTVNINSLLKQQINYDRLTNQQEINPDEKKLLTDYLGQMQAGKTYLQLFGMNQLNWHLNQNVKEYLTVNEFLDNDIDNLKQFIFERIKYQYRIQSNNKKERSYVQNLVVNEKKFIKSGSRKQIRETLKHKELTNNQISQTVKQLPRLTINNQDFTKWISVSKTQINISAAQTPKKSPRVFAIKTEQSTDFSSFNEGFSSGRLKGLYPSAKIAIQSSSFERKAIKYKSDLQLLPSCISILKQLLQHLFQNMKALTQTDKKQQQRFKIDQDIIVPQFLNKEFIGQIFRIYLYDITNSKKELAQVSCECGLMINEIYINCRQHSELHCYKDILKNSFYEIGDYICKVIVKLHDIEFNQNFKRYILMTTLFEGLYLFGEQQNTPKNIFSILNDTVLHLMIVWFFDSDQSNIYQQIFIKVFTVIFSKSPSFMVGNILFKLGLITSLQNAYFNFFVNQIKYTTGVESLFFYSGLLIFVIQKCLYYRKMQAILSNLEPLGSWEQLKDVEIDTNSKLVQFLDQILNESDGRSPRLLKKKTLTAIQLQNKNVIQNRKSQFIKVSNHKQNTEIIRYSMQSAANNVIQILKVKDKLMKMNLKRSIDY